MMKAIFLSIGLLLLFVLSLLSIVIFRQGVSRPIRYELPAGYKGWVVVRFEDPNCSSMQSKGIYHVIAISSSARGCTADPSPKGWTYHPVEYINPDGTRTKVPAKFITYGEDGRRLLFFVGTEEELKKSWTTAPWQ